MFDVLILGGGVAGVSCALVLGSAKSKTFASNKKIGIITHQKASYLQDALLNNVYGIAPNSSGISVLSSSLEHLSSTYPHVERISGEKVISVVSVQDNFVITTNHSEYVSKMIVVAVNSAPAFHIDGLMGYVVPHQKSVPAKNRVQLKNEDHKVAEGIYVAGTLAGHRSQVAIAAGSGAAVATDILTLWNDNIPSQSHDSIKK